MSPQPRLLLLRVFVMTRKYFRFRHITRLRSARASVSWQCVGKGHRTFPLLCLWQILLDLQTDPIRETKAYLPAQILEEKGHPVGL